MNIVFETDSILRGLGGGLLIGLSAVLLLAFNGRIAGISGILGGLVLDRKAHDRLWRLLFLSGLLAGAALAGLLPIPVPSSSTLHWLALTGAGLLVGFGTRLGNGCTSGHGICGLARLSGRSLAAVLTFMGFGFLTVYVIRHGGVL